MGYRADVAVDRSNVYSNLQLFILKRLFAKAQEVSCVIKVDMSAIRYLSESEHERKEYMRPAKLEELLAAASGCTTRNVSTELLARGRDQQHAPPRGSVASGACGFHTGLGTPALASCSLPQKQDQRKLEISGTLLPRRTRCGSLDSQKVRS